MDRGRDIILRDEERLLEGFHSTTPVVESHEVQPKLGQSISPTPLRSLIQRTCTHTAGLLSSLTSASCMAALACSIFPSLRKVAADINQRLLSSRRSVAARTPWVRMVDIGDSDGGGGGSDGGGGKSAIDRS